MKVPKILKAITAFMICLALIRAVNNAGTLSITDTLAEIQKFEFDFSRVNHLVQDFQNGTFATGFKSWDNSQTGIQGFFYNISQVLSSFFTTIVSVIKGVILALWNVLVEAVRVLIQTLNIVVKLCGFQGFIG